MATTLGRRLLSMVISARRAAVAEGCQERASALSDLEDSQQGHRTALFLTFPTPAQGHLPAQESWLREATSFRVRGSVSSSLAPRLLPLLVRSITYHNLMSHR